jgi:nucleotide-binding universal stress UspA family protein
MVVGAHGRSALSTLLLGSNAQRLLGAAQTDTLLVRGDPLRGNKDE